MFNDLRSRSPYAGLGGRVGRVTSFVSALAALTVVFTVACQSQPAASGSPAAGALAGGPRKPQGTIVVGVESLGNGAPGLLSRDADLSTTWQSLPVMETLEIADDKGNVGPNLAEGREMSPDSSKLTFHLRKGVQFHDGWGELTAEDVKFSVDEALNTKGSTAMAKDGFGGAVKSVDVADKYTAVFNLDPTKAQLLQVANFSTSSMAYFRIMSKKYVESVGPDKAAANPIGTGAWRMVERTPDHNTFEAVENHWRQTPYFQTLVMRPVPDPASMVAMLKAGDLDMAMISGDSRADVESAGLRVQTVLPGAGVAVVLGGLINPSFKTFDPKIPWVGAPKDAASLANALKVRKALSLALDRQALLNMPGGGTISCVTQFVPGTNFYNPAWQCPYDPAQAKQLLKEAGYPNGFDMGMLLASGMSGRTWMPNMSEAVAMQWEKNLGLKITRTPIEWAKLSSDMNRSRTLGQRAYAMGQGLLIEPWTNYYNTGRTGGGSNYRANTPELDKMLEAIAGEPNTAKRADLIRAFGQYQYDNYYNIEIGDVPQQIAISKKVGDFKMPWGSGSFQGLEYAKPAK